MKKENKKEAPIVSGSFQIASEEQKVSLDEVKKQHDLDEESLYYARLFAED